MVDHVLARNFAANLRMQVAHGVDRAEVEVFAEDEGSRDFFQRGAPLLLQVVAFVHHARLDPRIAFPLSSLRDEVVFKRDDRADERPRIAVRAQAHVHAKNLAVAGDVAQRGDQTLAEAREEVVGLDLATAGGFAVFRVNEDVVDVGRDVELAPAKLAHADHQQALRTSLGVQRLAELRGELAMQEVERDVGRYIGTLRHGFDDLGEGGLATDIAHDEGGHDALAQTAQHALEALFVDRCFGQEKLVHQPAVQAMVAKILEPEDNVRASFKQLAQVAAVGQGLLPFRRKQIFGSISHCLVLLPRWVGQGECRNGLSLPFKGRVGVGMGGRRHLGCVVVNAAPSPSQPPP